MIIDKSDKISAKNELKSNGKIIKNKTTNMIAVIVQKLFQLDLWDISGKESLSQEVVRISYAGDSINKSYFCKLLYNGTFQEEYLGKIWLWGALKMKPRLKKDYSLSIIEIRNIFSKLFLRSKCFIIPTWVYSYVGKSFDLDLAIKQSKSLKEDVRKIKNSEFSFEITRDRKLFNTFYYNMYKPRIINRFGEGVLLKSHSLLGKKFKKNGDLLLVKKENDYLGGHLIIYENNHAEIYSAGLKEGDRKYDKIGVSAAAYYFSFKFLKNKKFNKIGLGFSRGFLNDGVLRFKNKFCQTVKMKSPLGKSFILTAFDKSEGAKSFLIKNPFMFLGRNGLNAAIFSDDASLSQDYFLRICKDYHLKGIKKVCFYKFDLNEQNKNDFLESSDINDLELHSADELFDDYCHYS